MAAGDGETGAGNAAGPRTNMISTGIGPLVLVGLTSIIGMFTSIAG